MIRAAARRFAVSSSTAIKLMHRVRTTGSAAPARLGGHPRPTAGAALDAGTAADGAQILGERDLQAGAPA